MNNKIYKFDEFLTEKLKDGDDILKFLYSLKNPDVNGFLTDLLTSNNKQERKTYIEDILLEIGDVVDEEDFEWISKEIRKWINPRKNTQKI